MEHLVQELLAYWSNAYAPRAVIGLFSILTLSLAIRARGLRRCSSPLCIIWVLVGLIGTVFSVAPCQFITVVIRTEHIVRIRFLVGVISVLMLVVTLESVRSTQLQERYALLWVATAIALLVCVFFPGGVDLLRAATGMPYPTAIAVVAFTFLVLVAFHFSISLSSNQTKIAKMAQRIAILEARLGSLRKDGPKPGESQVPPELGPKESP